MTKEDLMVHEFRQADFEGGDIYFVVCDGTDTSQSGQVSEWFETEEEAINFIVSWEEE